MQVQYLVNYFILFLCFRHCTFAADSEEDGDESTEDQNRITPCDREIATKLCNDFKKKISDCANKMPADEKPLFFNCAEEMKLVKTDKWMPLMKAICDKEDEIVETAYDVIKCWNKKMNETVDQMKNDKVYPREFFNCSDTLFNEAVDKASCPCQMEKRQTCNTVPAPSAKKPGMM